MTALRLGTCFPRLCVWTNRDSVDVPVVLYSPPMHGHVNWSTVWIFGHHIQLQRNLVDPRRLKNITSHRHEWMQKEICFKSGWCCASLSTGSRDVLHSHVATQEPPGRAKPGPHTSREGSCRRCPQPQLWTSTSLCPSGQGTPAKHRCLRYF